jgi:hypothetical protein
MSNPAIVPLLVGVLIGWIIYFLLDLFFLRRPKSDSRVATLEADLQSCKSSPRWRGTRRRTHSR